MNKNFVKSCESMQVNNDKYINETKEEKKNRYELLLIIYKE